MVAHACNPSTLGGWCGQITWIRVFRTSLGYMPKPCLYKKYKNYLGVVTHVCSPSYWGGCGEKITSALEVEVAVSWDHITALQPRKQSKTLSQKQKQKQNVKPNYRMYVIFPKLQLEVDKNCDEQYLFKLSDSQKRSRSFTLNEIPNCFRSYLNTKK